MRKLHVIGPIMVARLELVSEKMNRKSREKRIPVRDSSAVLSEEKGGLVLAVRFHVNAPEVRRASSHVHTMKQISAVMGNHGSDTITASSAHK